MSVVFEAIFSDLRHISTVHVESFQALRPVCDVVLFQLDLILVATYLDVGSCNDICWVQRLVVLIKSRESAFSEISCFDGHAVNRGSTWAARWVGALDRVVHHFCRYWCRIIGNVLDPCEAPPYYVCVWCDIHPCEDDTPEAFICTAIGCGAVCCSSL